MKEQLEKLKEAFANLSGREKALVSSAGGVVALLLVWFAVITPALDAAAGMATRAELARRDLDLVQRLRVEYDEVQSRLVAVEQRIAKSTRGSLRTRLESLAAAAAVKVDSMEPQPSQTGERYRETKVEVTLKQVDLPRTIRYLHEIESSEELLSVKSLRLRTRPDKSGFLDVTFSVSSFEPI